MVSDPRAVVVQPADWKTNKPEVQDNKRVKRTFYDKDPVDLHDV